MDFIGFLVILAIVSYFLLCNYVSRCGGKREIGSFMGFILAFVLSPIIGLLFVMASDRLEDKRLRRLQIDYYEKLLK